MFNLLNITSKFHTFALFVKQVTYFSRPSTNTKAKYSHKLGRAMAQAVSRRPLTAEA
jgi:hypothetical protein